jgi:hypothetical protein
MSPVKYELGFYISEDAILHSHSPENLKSYILSILIYRNYQNTIYQSVFLSKQDNDCDPGEATSSNGAQLPNIPNSR